MTIIINKTTQKALQQSIVKWQKIHDAIKARTYFDPPSADNCPLCHLFNDWFVKGGMCERCPIRLKTGARFCGRTPYIFFCGSADNNSRLKNSLKEVRFLTNLLEECEVEAGVKNHVSAS